MASGMGSLNLESKYIIIYTYSMISQEEVGTSIKFSWPLKRINEVRVFQGM